MTTTVIQNGKSYGPFPVTLTPDGTLDQQTHDRITKDAENQGAAHGYADVVVKDQHGTIVHEEIGVV